MIACKRISQFVAAAILLALSAAAQSLPPLAVELRALQPVSTANCVTGQIVLFTTVTAFVANGISFPAGSIASGEIVECKPPRRLARGGLLVIELRGVQLPSGQKLSLHGTAEFHGGSRTLVAAGGALAAGLIVTPYLAPAGLLVHGAEAIVPAGAIVVATVGDNSNPSDSEKPTQPAPPPLKARH